MADTNSAEMIIKDNLSHTSCKQKAVYELKICNLADAADFIADYVLSLYKNGIDLKEIFAMISEEHFISDTKKPSQNNFEPELFSVLENRMQEDDKALFAKLLFSKIIDRGINIGETELLGNVNSEETFTYVKNPLADEAYDIFSQDFKDPRVAYSKNIDEACIAASEKKVGYCILPIEEKGVRIPAIFSRIFEQDLKIISVTPVFGFDGSADMKYALLSMDFSFSPSEEGDERYLEVVFPQTVSISDIIYSAAFFNSRLYRINTIPLKTSEGTSNCFSAVFKTEKDSFSDFLLFLHIFCSDFIPIGLYKNLE